MAGFVVAHFRKVKTDAGLGNVAGHNSREGIILDNGSIENDPKKLPEWLIHPDRTYRNEGQLGKQSDSIIRRRYGAIERAELKRKPQRNAAAAVEAVFTASPGAFKTFGEWKRYFNDCLTWTDKKFGHDNVLQWNTHYDEKTPHLHVLLVPIVRDPELGNKYSSADFLGGREGLRQIQDEIAEKVGKQHGLERGQEGSKARHTDQTEWIAAVRKKEGEIKRREEALKTVEEKLTYEKKLVLKTLEKCLDMPNRDIATRVFNFAINSFPQYLNDCERMCMEGKDLPAQSKQEQKQKQEQGRGRS